MSKKKPPPQLPEDSNDWSVPAEIITQIEQPLGAIVIQHAFAEQALDTLLADIAEDAIAAGIFEQHPMKVGDKIRDVKKAARKLDRLAGQRDLLVHACTGMKLLNGARDILVHGVPVHFFDGDDPQLVFMRQKPKDAKLKGSFSLVSLIALARNSGSAGGVAADLHQAATAILGIE